jgi:hypothetical protein
MNEGSFFIAALERPTLEARRAFLAGACAGDLALLQRLLHLLAAHEKVGGILEQGAEVSTSDSEATPPTTPAQQGDAPASGRILDGRYKLLEQMGEGGMGTVWMAEQTEPVNPRHPDYRKAYRLNRSRMAETLLELKEHAAAAEAAGQFLQMAVDPSRDSYTVACLLAGCARLASRDERLPAGRRQKVATAYGDRALAALRQAIDKGAREAAEMPKDPSFDPLRSRKDFQKLLAEWEARRKP